MLIKSGESDVVVAGGQENMSLSPHTIYMRNGVKLGDATMVDSAVYDGLTDAFVNIHMGVTGQFGFPRSTQVVHFTKSFAFLMHANSNE